MFGYRLYRINGPSMEPALHGGDVIAARKAKTPKPGRIYVVDHSDLGTIVKRLKSIQADGRYIFEGDNAASTPASIIAPVMGARILGEARWAVASGRLKRL